MESFPEVGIFLNDFLVALHEDRLGWGWCLVCILSLWSSFPAWVTFTFTESLPCRLLLPSLSKCFSLPAPFFWF